MKIYIKNDRKYNDNQINSLVQFYKINKLLNQITNIIIILRKK